MADTLVEGVPRAYPDRLLMPWNPTSFIFNTKTRDCGRDGSGLSLKKSCDRYPFRGASRRDAPKWIVIFTGIVFFLLAGCVERRVIKNDSIRAQIERSTRSGGGFIVQGGQGGNSDSSFGSPSKPGHFIFGPVPEH